jgi:hypothetical protein
MNHNQFCKAFLVLMSSNGLEVVQKIPYVREDNFKNLAINLFSVQLFSATPEVISPSP